MFSASMRNSRQSLFASQFVAIITPRPEAESSHRAIQSGVRRPAIDQNSTQPIKIQRDAAHYLLIWSMGSVCWRLALQLARIIPH